MASARSPITVLGNKPQSNMPGSPTPSTSCPQCFLAAYSPPEQAPLIAYQQKIDRKKKKKEKKYFI